VSGTEDRERILARFEVWLDSALGSEDPPFGIDAEILAAADSDAAPEDIASADSYGLWSAMTALTQEVKLQGRAFQELARTVGAQPEAIAAELGENSREREREIESRTRRDTERRCWKQALEILIDIDDRLSRGLDSVRASQKAANTAPGLLARLFAKRDATGAEVTNAIVRGYELALERVSHAFEQLNAHQIQCLGEPFDPRTMNAVDRAESAVVAEGSVLEVYRSGYEWGGEVLRTAQVKVACAPGSEKR
jgi:molecular chaperone GrpE